jgi:hypothetical protein
MPWLFRLLPFESFVDWQQDRDSFLLLGQRPAPFGFRIYLASSVMSTEET